MTKEEKIKKYKHELYMRNREKRLAYAKKYVDQFRNDEAYKKKMRWYSKNYYRKKCGLKPIKWEDYKE